MWVAMAALFEQRGYAKASELETIAKLVAEHLERQGSPGLDVAKAMLRELQDELAAVRQGKGGKPTLTVV